MNRSLFSDEKKHYSCSWLRFEISRLRLRFLVVLDFPKVVTLEGGNQSKGGGGRERSQSKEGGGPLLKIFVNDSVGMLI